MVKEKLVSSSKHLMPIELSVPENHQMEILHFIVLCTLISSSVLEISTAADTIAADQSITTGETLVSSGQKFVLGFFTPSRSKNRSFLGIWYKNYPQIVVWVANRENPVPDSNGVLTIRSSDGNLVLLDGTGNLIWSSTSSTSLRKQNSSSVVAQILDSGNFVLMDKTDSNAESYIWQSFDHPSDTQLPGMKLGWDLRTGLNRYLRSWKGPTDPSPGDFTYTVDITGLPQTVLLRGSQKKLRITLSAFKSNPVIKPITVNNPDEVYYSYESNIVTRFVVNESGLLQRFVLEEGSSEWAVMYTVQNDMCDDYGKCGANGICKINKAPICECLEGFVPKSESEWDVLDWSGGCVRTTPVGCRKGDGFVVVKNVKYPDLLEFWLGKGMDHKECKAECLRNCSCAAYAVVNLNVGGSGCLFWSGDLIDIRDVIQQVNGEEIYIRMPASELDQNEKKKKKMVMIVVVVSTASGMVVLTFLCWLILFKRKKSSPKTKKENAELQMFDLTTLAIATENFSSTHMIGEGGFGQVYQGKLPFGQEIAVKRLSNNSRQGLQEFKNEVLMISKLQHRNLVRLLGCCIAEEERMLVYEYMPNKSLDYFIFDENRRVQLKWPKRFDIAMGIARGILYLHQDSRLRIIHRDLKTSNILLDCDLNPKVSDFGIARIFREGQMEAETKQVIGTYGYMSPEYAIDGKFSIKSDVFSLGVLLLEIVSGQKNRKFHHPDHHHNLLGHAWLLWDQDKALELMDPCLEDSSIESQVLRCIHVGLLCVQKLPEDRPIMPYIVFMLGNEGVTLPQPKQPGFFVERSAIDSDSSRNERRQHTENVVTITMLEAR